MYICIGNKFMYICIENKFMYICIGNKVMYICIGDKFMYICIGNKFMYICIENKVMYIFYSIGTLQSREGFPLESQHMLHAARYSDALLTALGGEFSKCFDPEIQVNPNYVIPKLYTNPELEQVTLLMLLGHEILKTSGLFVGKPLTHCPATKF